MLKITYKIANTDDKNWNKIFKLTMHEWN